MSNKPDRSPYRGRRSFTGLSIPKINTIPCALHPDARAYDNGFTDHICRECANLARKARYRAKGESMGGRYATARNLALRHGHEWALTIEQYERFVTSTCTYGDGAGVGIDRIDSSKGYIAGNCQPCCQRHNRMKSDLFSHAQALEIARTYGIECGNDRKP